LNQLQIDSQKIMDEAFPHELGGSPITPPQNYSDSMIETNPKKRKFEKCFIFSFLDG
jgi:hypothetical protein